MLAALCGRTTQALGITVGRCVSTCRPTGLISLRGHVALGGALLRCVHADPSSPRPPKPACRGAAHPWFSCQAGSCASPPHTGLHFLPLVAQQPFTAVLSGRPELLEPLPSASSEPRGWTEPLTQTSAARRDETHMRSVHGRTDAMVYRF